MRHHVVLSAVRGLAAVARADLGRGVRLDPEEPAGILNDPHGRRAGRARARPRRPPRERGAPTHAGAGVPGRCERVARAADDDLPSPLTMAEREQFTGLLIRISGTNG